jgi:hypothetical protein
MELKKDHLPYYVLHDVAYRRQNLNATQWSHLHYCFECTLRLANLRQIEEDLEDIRRKYDAA